MSSTGGMFAGSMPEFYQCYMVPMNFEPHARILAARFSDLASGHVLEIAAGTGAVTRALAYLLPNAVSITATDLNDQMLDQARSQSGAERVRWQKADVASLPFYNASFDAAACQFGVMFFPDKLAAFREVARVLRPGGRYVFSVRNEIERNLLGYTADQELKKLFSDNSPRSNRVPFSYCDPVEIRSDLTAAGFTNTIIETVPEHSRAPSAQSAATAYIHGGVLRHEIEAAHGSGWLERATEAVSVALGDRFGHGPVAIPNQALLVTTQRLPT